jgi:hypothetical protein
MGIDLQQTCRPVWTFDATMRGRQGRFDVLLLHGIE